VGRDRELASIVERLRSAGDGEGGVVLVSGEPGAGKTRLLEEAARLAEGQGWRVLLGHAYDAEGMPPYLPFVEALQDYVRACPLDALVAQLGDGARDVALILPEVRRRLPDIPVTVELDAESARYQLFESIADFLGAIAAASDGGLMLCLDDLHWADDSTLALLEHLGRRLAGAPFLMLAIPNWKSDGR
jgi:predicted ATPase